MNENQPDVLITRALTARAGRRETPNRGAYVIVVRTHPGFPSHGSGRHGVHADAAGRAG
jgi:hypothetical protein